MSLQQERIDAMNQAIARLPIVIADNREVIDPVQLLSFSKIHQHGRRVWEDNVKPELGDSTNYDAFAEATRNLMRTFDPARVDAGSGITGRPDWMNAAIKECVDALLRVINELPCPSHGQVKTELQREAARISEALSPEKALGG